MAFPDFRRPGGSFNDRWQDSYRASRDYGDAGSHRYSTGAGSPSVRAPGIHRSRRRLVAAHSCEDLAERVSGVRDVQNELRVAGGA